MTEAFKWYLGLWGFYRVLILQYDRFLEPPVCTVQTWLSALFGRGLLIEFDLLHVQAWGGIILLIALIVVIIQASLIYLLPKLWSSEVRSIRAINNFAWACCESFVFLFPLVIFEFLILWVTLGQSLPQLIHSAVFDIGMLGSYLPWLHSCTTASSRDKRLSCLKYCLSTFLRSATVHHWAPLAHWAMVLSRTIHCPQAWEPFPWHLQKAWMNKKHKHPATRWQVSTICDSIHCNLIAACAFAVLRTCLPNMVQFTYCRFPRQSYLLHTLTWGLLQYVVELC